MISAIKKMLTVKSSAIFQREGDVGCCGVNHRDNSADLRMGPSLAYRISTVDQGLAGR